MDERRVFLGDLLGNPIVEQRLLGRLGNRDKPNQNISDRWDKPQ